MPRGVVCLSLVQNISWMKNYFVCFDLKRFCVSAGLLILSVLFPSMGRCLAQPSLGNILIISSSESEISGVPDNIAEFVKEYKALGGQYTTTVEEMNGKSFSEAHEWAGRMQHILLNYQGEKSPSLILLMGQEALSAYMSVGEELVDPKIPVLCGMASRYAIKLPEVGEDLSSWTPQSLDVLDASGRGRTITGVFYEYDIDKNVQLVRQLYPAVERIAFLSDNSCSGVSLQAQVKEQMRNYPELDLVLLDGRTSSLSSIVDQIVSLPENTALLVGEWNVDFSNNYFTPNVLFNLIGRNKKVAIFALAMVGTTHGALGGYVPLNEHVGKELALLAVEDVDYFDQMDATRSRYIENGYVFDFKRINKAGISEDRLPQPHEMHNRSSEAGRYNYPLIAIISLLGLLLLGYLVVFYYFFGVKKLKEALEESEANNKLILNNLKAEIRFITPDYKIKWYNDFVSSKLHHQLDFSQGMECYRVRYGFDDVCEFCPAREAIATGKSTEVIVELPEHHFTSMLASPVFDSENKLTGVVVRSEDVTKDKEQEQELRAAKEKAEESDRLKSAFLANMSHEIRTPLNAIVGFSSILLDESIPAQDRKSFSEIIRINSDLLLRLINDILDISRLETDRITFNLVPCEIVSLANNVISTTQYARETNLTFVLDAPFTSYELTTDVQRLQQVLINLMFNAVKFTAAGTVTLGIREDAENDRVVFSVTDTGCGIPLEKQKQVFERFEKLDEYAQGTGLGLAICKITIDLLGGEIWVDENYTEGARFVFTHPRHPVIKKKHIQAKG